MKIKINTLKIVAGLKFIGSLTYLIGFEVDIIQSYLIFKVFHRIALKEFNQEFISIISEY